MKLLVLFIAIVLWVHQIMLKTHTLEINIPMKLIETPQNLIPDSFRLPEVTVEISATGKDLFLFQISKKFFQIDTSHFRYGKNQIALKPDQLIYSDKIKLNINSINKTEDFFINMDKLVERTKPLKIQYSSTNEEEFFLKNKIKNANRKITLKGPLALLNEVEQIFTKKISSKMIVDGKLTVELISPDPKIDLFQDSIEFEITNTKIVHKTISLIPIKYPETENITIIPQKVSVMVSGPKEIMEKLNTNSIIANLNISNLKKDFANVSFEIPAGVKIIEYTPQKIQVIQNDQQ
ncbi:MAG: YbbR-like domain-containing protein [Candidatus Cloacimonetes bacterium]|nr:YbbR-like domain-containing protein [Candidatus Cloacimonadota bacterium]